MCCPGSSTGAAIGTACCRTFSITVVVREGKQKDINLQQKLLSRAVMDSLTESETGITGTVEDETTNRF